MKLKHLLKNLPVQVRDLKDVEITGLCADSRQVAPGNLFIAKRGLNTDGAQFIPQAVAAGAAAILTDLYNPFLGDVVQIIHPRIAEMEARLASAYFHAPDNHLFVMGVTGTNGKSTTTYLIKHLFDQLEHSCGLIGTIEWIAGQHSFPASHTTPDLLTTYKLLAEMVLQKSKAVAMEVSSHALDQGRVLGIEFDVAIFTNLTLDHLDYHQTMENYAAAKAKLFEQMNHAPKKLGPKRVVINGDSPVTETMVQNCRVQQLFYGLREGVDLRATDIVLSAQNTRFFVEYQGERVLFVSPLIGRFNVYNCLAAIGAGLSRGFSLEKIAQVLPSFRGVLGRMERVANRRGLHIFIDYAHTDDALRNVLEALREIRRGKLIVVFGCGGSRDRSKRPKMGAVAEELADLVVVTSDNPRNEEPKAIIAEILQGLKAPNKALVEPDRSAAISAAIRYAQGDDIVLIAGKGHETTQVFAHQTIDFDDRKVVANV